MNNKNEDQLPRWINTIRRSLSPYPQTMSACECGDGRFACGGGMCPDCAYRKIAGACGVNITDAYFRALESLRNVKIKYDEYQSKQTKS